MHTSTAPYFEARDLSFRFPSIDGSRGRRVLDDFSFSLRARLAPPLADTRIPGKTTVSRIAAGLVPRFTGGRLRGTLLVDGRDALSRRPFEMMEQVVG